MQFNFITLAPRNCDCKNNIISFSGCSTFFFIFSFIIITINYTFLHFLCIFLVITSVARIFSL